MKNVEIVSLKALKVWVEDFVTQIKPPHILLLSGEMGSGKTQLTSFMVEALGGSESSSPSFALHNSYPTIPRIEHLDLYRLEDEDDLESVGFWDLFEEKDSIIVVEWADRLDLSFLPHNWSKTKIHIEKSSCQKRYLKVFNSL